MPKLIEVWVVGDAPQKGEAPSLWTAKLQQAASGPVVMRQLSVWPWKADGKYAKAVDIFGVTWQAQAGGWRSPRPTKVDVGEEAYRQTPVGKRKHKRPTLADALARRPTARRRPGSASTSGRPWRTSTRRARARGRADSEPTEPD